MNRSLKSMIRKKQRLYNQAKKTHKWSNYKFFQKECRKAFRDAECSYINEQIQKGLSQNNVKPFWQYVKGKKQNNFGVSPLLRDGKLEVDAVEKS